MKPLVLIVLGLGLAAPAFAQQADLPTFDAFEQQKRDNNQLRFDDINKAQRDELLRPVAPERGATVTGVERAMRLQELERERERLRQDLDQERQMAAREKELDAISAPNRVIPPYSSQVIDDPARYVLPPAPSGQYYARVDGRFALVDRTSQKVVKLFDRNPNETSFDIPSTPSRDVSLPYKYPKLPKQPPLPSDPIPPDSPLVVKDPAKLSLGPLPRGSYYAEIDGRIYLVDEPSRKVIALIRSGP